MMRLAKFLASAGVASRRSAEDLIRGGSVLVNGKLVKSVATTVDPGTDMIQVKGKTVQAEHLVYYLVHKPIGYLSAASGDRGAKLVTALVPKSPRVYPVGALDKGSGGPSASWNRRPSRVCCMQEPPLSECGQGAAA